MSSSSKDWRGEVEMGEEQKEEVPNNVIRVNFGAAAAEPELEPYDSSQFPDDPLAAKKYDIFSKYIDNGMVSITLDPRTDGVVVPEHFARRPELVLNFSHRFYIEDFTYDQRAVCASLSFSGRPFYCVVPWGAVKMLLSHHDNSVAVFDADMLF